MIAMRRLSTVAPGVKADALGAALQAMVDEGFLKPPSRTGPTPTPRWRPVKVKGTPLSQTVIDDREDRV